MSFGMAQVLDGPDYTNDTKVLDGTDDTQVRDDSQELDGPIFTL